MNSPNLYAERSKAWGYPLRDNHSKASLFQWIRKQCPRPERPHALLSNLKSKEAENRLATRDQAPQEGELTLIWQSASSCAQIRVIQ
ncbi:hypothetical protein, partial [Vibrio jasicida]|uniref:hypothetical protein n=1 Tax=Vibrio jasicida TaxID=766224 RepID=UPI001CA5DC1E